MELEALNRYHCRMRLTALRLVLLCVIGVSLAVALIGGAVRLFMDRPLCRHCDVILVSLDAVDARTLEAGFPLLMEAATREGVVFENAYGAENRGFMGHASLLTGELPARLGMLDERTGIPKNAPFLPEEFFALGYETAAFAGGSLVAPAWGFDRGFSHWEQLPPQEGPEAPLAAAHKWLQERENRSPYFLFVAPYDLYGLLGPRSEGDGFSYDTLERAGSGDALAAKELEEGYLEKMRSLDEHIARLITAGRENGREPVVVVTASVGRIAFDEPGVRIRRTTPPLYSILNVPLVMIVPGTAPRTVAATVEARDTAPTLVDLVDGGKTAFPGASLVPYLRGRGESDRGTFAYILVDEPEPVLPPERFYAALAALKTEDVVIPEEASPLPALEDTHMLSAAYSRWHMVESPDGTRRLYDTVSDPEERKDLYGSTGALGFEDREIIGMLMAMLAVQKP